MKSTLFLLVCLLYVVLVVAFRNMWFYGLIGVIVLFILIDRKKCVSLFFKTDWLESSKSFYLGIDPIYRRAFWISFFVLNIVFMYHSISLIWGNHDWDKIISGVSNKANLWEGRFSGGWFSQIISGSLTPILNNAISIFGITFGSILLAYYWEIRKNLYSYVVFSLFIGSMPLILSWFYYIFMSATQLWTLSLIVGSLIIAESSNKKNFFIYSIFSIILLVIAFGAYMPVLNTIGVVLLGRVFVKYYYLKENLKEIFLSLKYVFINIFIALGLYYVIFTLLKKYEISIAFKNADITPLIDMPEKILQAIRAAFVQFKVSYPFVDYFYLKVLLALCIVALICIFFNIGKIGLKRLLISLLILSLMIISSKVSAVIANINVMYANRIDWFGLTFIYAFMIVVLSKSDIKFFRNILFILMIVILQMNIVRDIEAQKVWKFGFDYEKQLALNAINQIQSNENFDKNKTYKLVAIGEWQVGRVPYYDEQKMPYKRDSIELLHYHTMTIWNLPLPIRFYAPEIKLDKFYMIDYYSLNDQWKPKEESCVVVNKIYDFLKNDANEFPKNNSVYVDDEYIVIVWNLNNKDFILNFCNEENK